MSGGLRAPATGGATLQARLSGALGHWRPVEHTKTDPKDHEDLKVDTKRTSKGLKDQLEKSSTSSYYPNSDP